MGEITTICCLVLVGFVVHGTCYVGMQSLYWKSERLGVKYDTIGRDGAGHKNFPRALDLDIGGDYEAPRRKKLVKQFDQSVMSVSKRFKKEYAAYTDPALEMSVVVNENDHMVGLLRRDGKDCILVDGSVNCLNGVAPPFKFNDVANEHPNVTLSGDSGQTPLLKSTASGTYFAEICAFTDYAWYKRIEGLARFIGFGDPLELAEMYLTAFINEINLMYTTLGRGKYRLVIVLADTMIARNAQESPWSVPDVNGVLEMFYAEVRLRDFIPRAFDMRRCDHYMGLSGTNLAIKGSIDAAGRSNGIPASCSPSGFSIIEDYIYTAYLAAHELGHALGALHDEKFSSPSECSNYPWIMTTTMRPPENRTWFSFSVCSHEFIGHWLAGGGTCFSEHSFDIGKLNADRCLGFTGELLTTEEQCLRYGGDGVVTNPSDFGCSKVIFCQGLNNTTIPIFPPDGTMCGREGSNRMCLRGLCQAVDPTLCSGVKPMPPRNDCPRNYCGVGFRRYPYQKRECCRRYTVRNPGCECHLGSLKY